MPSLPHLVIGAGTVAVMAAVFVGGILPLVVEVRAARGRRGADACGFEADERLPWAARAAGVVREAALLSLAVAAAPLTVGRRSFGSVRAALERPPLVLLLGWGQHPILWRTLLRRLRADGWGQIEIVGWTSRRLSLDAGVDALGAAVARLRDATGAGRVDVLAHGTGGLVARAYVRSRGPRAAIARVLTLGTPHQGTVAAAWREVAGFVGAVAPDSPVMARLAAADPVPAGVDFVAIYSREDALVLPPGNAYYPGAFGIAVRGPGHLGLLTSWHVYELVRENLAAETAPVRTTVASGRRADA